jgi:hypothetical protein
LIDAWLLPSAVRVTPEMLLLHIGHYLLEEASLLIVIFKISLKFESALFQMGQDLRPLSHLECLFSNTVDIHSLAMGLRIRK